MVPLMPLGSGSGKSSLARALVGAQIARPGQRASQRQQVAHKEAGDQIEGADAGGEHDVPDDPGLRQLVVAAEHARPHQSRSTRLTIAAEPPVVA